MSLYIDNATNPMDYGNTHFYFRCQAEAQYMQNWDSADMKPYTTAATDAYNFNRDVNSSNPEDHLYKDISQSSYGAELVLDYNISIKANVPNKATKKRNTITTANGSAKDISTLQNEISEINTALNNGGAVYNYKDLAIIAPNGLRYMETYFIAGNGVNNRSGIDSRDTVVIDNKIRNSDGKCFTDLFERLRMMNSSTSVKASLTVLRAATRFRRKLGNGSGAMLSTTSAMMLRPQRPTWTRCISTLMNRTAVHPLLRSTPNPTALRNPILCTLLRIPVSISSL